MATKKKATKKKATKKKKDPKQEQLEELESARKAGKTELSVDTDSKQVVEAVFEITTLEDLTLSVDMPRLPPGIGKLTALTSLSLEGELRELPPDIGQLKRVEDLRAYSMELASLPDEFGGMSSLKKAVLWSNKLKTLPASVGKLAKLETLELKWNQITSLPEEIGGMTALRELDLDDNRLTDVPDGFAKLKSLRILKLGENKLARFPVALCHLPALEMLFLGPNKIPEIPPEIAKLNKLIELGLHENKIKKLPEALFKTNLVILRLEGNQIREVPTGIGAMKRLADLALWDNPIKGVPEELLGEGKDAVFLHLGLSEPNVVSGDLPEEKEMKAVVKAYKDRIDSFVRETKHLLSDDRMRDKLVAFITGKNDTVPPGRLGDHYSFGHIVSVLAPFDRWTFVDRRLMTFITQAAWDFKQPGQDYDSGYSEGFFRWLAPQIEKKDADGLFTRVIATVLEHGVDEEAVLRRALIEMHARLLGSGGEPSSFGHWVIDKAPEHVAMMTDLAKEYWSVREALTPFLMEHAGETFEQVAPALLSIEPDEDGEIHLPTGALGGLCAKAPQRYEALLLEGIERTDCLGCKGDAVKVLAECYPKHKARARGLVAELLAAISEKKNKSERFYLSWAGGPRWGDGTAPFIAWALDHFGAGIKAAVFDYAEKTKVYDVAIAETVAKTLAQDGVEIVGEGLNMEIAHDRMSGHFRRIFAALEPMDWSKYHDKGWELARSAFPGVRAAACHALGKLDSAVVFPRAQELLAAKRAHERQSGVMLLGMLGTREAHKALEALLATEASDDARDLAVASLYADETKTTMVEAARRVASASGRGKLAKPVAKWLDEKKLPPLTWAGTKKKVDVDTVRFLLHRQTRPGEIEADPEARGIYALIDRKTSGAFAAKLLDLVLKNGGGKAANRFALAMVGLLGDDRIIAPLEKHAIDKRNPNAVVTLGLLQTMEAARALDRIIKVFRVKYPNVREPAQEAFSTIAAAMGMTTFELADAMLPTFGFSGLTGTLKAGKLSYKMVITALRKVALVENGRVLASPPKTLPAKQKAELKALGKEVQDAARQLSSSLEYYLIVRRRWPVADWRAFFLNHPLAFAFAQGFVWGVYGGKSNETFRVQADQSLVDVSGAEVTFAKGAEVGLVHPFELDEAARDLWLAALSGVIPPFKQIDRPVFEVPPEEASKRLSFQLEDEEVNASTFKARAERLGWRRGSVVDGGGVSAYKKNYPNDRIEAFIRIDGVNVQSYDSGEEASLQDFFFVGSGSVATGSYIYDEPRDATDHRLIQLSDVPPIVYSETVADLHGMVK